MSYSYGPTVVYPAFTMSEPFGCTSFDAKENSWMPAPAKEAFAVYQDKSCEGSMAKQMTSTSSRVPLGERNTNSTSSQHYSQPAAKRPSGAPAPRRVREQQQWKDIDAENKDNPLACSEYAQAIFEHLHTAELAHRPNPGYVHHVQLDMTSHMRHILVDWLVEVAQEYRLTSDTLHLTIDLLNRYLSVQPIKREELQLAGIACMWVASKFEEIYAPTARNFCYITDNTYDQVQLVDMEERVLAALQFTLAVPTAKTFQRRYLQAAAADEQLHYLAAFLLELSLMDEHMIAYLPSQVAAGSVYLARSMLGRKPWDPTLAHYSRYSEAEARLVASELAYTHAQIQGDGNFLAILEKYSSERLLNVSSMIPCQHVLQYSERWQQRMAEAAATGASSSSEQGSQAGASSSSGGFSIDMELI